VWVFSLPISQSIFFIRVILFISSISVGAADIADESMRLKDGSLLYIRDDDTMHMQDKDGNPMSMKDDVEMELEDETFIMTMNRQSVNSHIGLF
jgi:hypothetical protein